MSTSPDLIPQLTAWTYGRQHLDRSASGPLAALQAVAAAYSSHPSAPLTLLARSPAFDAANFQDLEQNRRAIRIPALRESIFLVPVEFAARFFAATRPPAEKLAPRLAYAGLDATGYARFKACVLAAAQEPLTPDDLHQLCGLDSGVPADVKITVAVRIMAREGLILRIGGSLRSDNLRYVATEAWLGGPIEPADPEDSLGWLAEAYLQAFGPARVTDFAWWAGVPRRRATAALTRVTTVDCGGGLLLPAGRQADYDNVEPLDPEAIALLPKWDAYTMGFAPDGRQRFIQDRHLGRAYTGPGGAATSGDGLPLVLRGGRAVARWSHRVAGNTLHVELTPFDSTTQMGDLDSTTFSDIARLLGATRVQMAVAAPA